MGWTESQQNAIDARGRNILVSAAAGPRKNRRVGCKGYQADNRQGKPR